MHATVQPGRRSPKPMSSPTSASQLKSGADSIQNSVSSIPSQVKGRKRERVDQGPEFVKRERSTKNDDGDSCHLKQDTILKTEIAKITEKGGLIDTEGVEKLVQLMVPDRNVKKIDLASRSLLAAVIAATDKFDCLSRFVQLRGLPVLDEWLQEAHKGKIGDGDKPVEEFLLVLLRALNKLPVNLQALQACNIGKSVNHLRTHKNSEIHKKARGLVDTWKKRVEAEMIINDAKSGSGQTVPFLARQRLPEAAQGGNRHSGGSSDVAVKSSVTNISASKNASLKIVGGENTSRSASASPGFAKSVPSPVSATANSKDGQPRVAALSGSSDLPMVNARDEKSSSSSQSHNSQSYSSNHAKAGGLSGKEDAKSSTAMSVNKVSGGSSRHRKSINGFSGSTPSGGQRETGSNRNSDLHKNSTSEKISQSGLMEKTLDRTSLEGHTPKLIVKIRNRGQSPAQSASAGSLDDPSIVNSLRASSPVLSEKPDQFDRCSKDKSDSNQANIGSDVKTESWQSNDFKDILSGSDEGDGSPEAITDEERCRTVDDCKKILDVSKAASSSSENENKARNLQDSSCSSMNALIEGVKYSEADDVGMNLLASVAAGEISKSELVLPTGSPQKDVIPVEQSCAGDAVIKSSEDYLVRDECYSNDGGHKKQSSISGYLGANDENSGFMVSGGKAAGERNMGTNSSSINNQMIETCLESKGKLNERPGGISFDGFSESTIQEARDSDSSKQLKEKVDRGVNAGGNIGAKVSDVVGEIEAEAIEKSSQTSSKFDVKDENCTTEGLSSGRETTLKSPSILVQFDSTKGAVENVFNSSGYCADNVPEDLNARESERNDNMASQNLASQSKKQRNERESDTVTVIENRGLCSSVTGLAAEYVEENSGTKEVHDQDVGQVLNTALPSVPSQEMDQRLGPKGSKFANMEAEEVEECNSTTADASSMSAAGVSDVDAKVEFDLNEGFSADDGKCGEYNSITMHGCAPAVRLISPFAFPASSMSCVIPSITVAAAAKGPFMPPEDLLKSKGELGWKGSAATSAFRPAEPRKVVEMPLGMPTTPILNVAAAKQSRTPLDIDLNVADERILADLSPQTCAHLTDCVSIAANGHDPTTNKLMGSPACVSGGLGLDLNLVDEASDVGNCFTSNSHKIDVPLLPVKSSASGPPNREVSVHRDFDLNNGPAVDEVTTEPLMSAHLVRSSVLSQPPVSGLRMSNAELGNFSSWFPSTGNTYSAVTISSIMPDRGDQSFSIVAPNGPQRMFSPATGGNPFGPDVYRGTVLSSPAVPYPSAPIQYPVFPFNSSFPLPSMSFSGGTTNLDSTSAGRLCFPAVNSQLIGPAGTVSSHYPRPYVVSLPDGSNSSSSENSRKWARQGLDLNAGPGSSDIEGRDESSPLVPRQLSVASSQFQLGGGVVKRKECDGGWDGYKQSSWQ